MHYEINVAYHGMHFFATHERSLTTRDKMVTVYNELFKRFPQSEGFTITVTRHSHMSERIDI